MCVASFEQVPRSDLPSYQQLSSALTCNLVFNSIMKRLSLWPGNTGDKQAADLFEAYTGQVDHIYGISFTQRLFAPMLEPLIRAAYRAMESQCVCLFSMTNTADNNSVSVTLSARQSC